MKQTIYFDNAATTFPKPEIVYETMDKVYRSYGVNAGRSSYNLAREANKLINQTREGLAELVNVNNPNKVIFTPSATIAMNQIIFGLDWGMNKTVYVTPFEHNAIMRPLHYIRKKHNINIKTIPFDPETFELDYEKMTLEFSRSQPDFIFMSHVSNVTGFILPITRIVESAKKYDSTIVLDCAQSMGLIPIDAEELEVDYLVFAGHKTLYGPFGIAGFIDRSKISLNQYTIGGTGSDSLNLDMPDYYPAKYEAASHNIHAIAGLNAALRWIKDTSVQEISKKEMELTEKLIHGLKQIYGVKLYLPKNLQNHVGIVSCTFDDYKPDELGQLLDEDYDIAVRTGYHCAPIIHDFMATKDIGGTVRFSLGYFNDDKDIDHLLECLHEL
jgi:cysteine desulfurase family protein